MLVRGGTSPVVDDDASLVGRLAAELEREPRGDRVGQRRFAESVDMNEDPPVYDVVFDYNSGSISAVVYKGQSELGTVTVVSGEKWLFLGFQGLNGGTNTLQAEFQTLEIQAR